MFRLTFFLTSFCLLLSAQVLFAQSLPYKNPALPVPERVKDLLGRMTLEEKLMQTQCIWNGKGDILDEKGNFDEKKAGNVLAKGMGQIARISDFTPVNQALSRSPRETVLLANRVQEFFVEKTRLGIPVMFHEESLHGQQAKDATNFPSPLALASSWNPDLLSEIYTSVAQEVRARGGHQVLAPVLDIVRDPRWGRTEETLGEDPYLTSRLALAEIKAYQGTTDNIDKKHVIATLKHFGVHGQPEGGINVGPVFVDERTLREVFFVPFKACIQEGKALALMPCYSEISGIPSHANHRHLTDIIRKEWGFQGIVVSDYNGITDLVSLHKIVTDTAAAAVTAFKAGVDVEAPDRFAFPKLVQAVKAGQVSEAYVNEVVSRILAVKFKLGLFESPYTDAAEAEKIVGSAENRSIALKAARESMVLLKNQGNVLPLNASKIKKIALIGPNADRCVLGGYSNEPRQRITPLKALKEKYGAKMEILYSEGCRLTDKGDWFTDPVVLSPRADNLKRIADAVAVAKNAEVIVLCLGGNEATTREAWADNHLGDLPNLDLIGEQNDLIKALLPLGKPIVACVFSGPPLAFGYLNDNVPAILNCWYLGQETGYAVVEVLFGEVSPSGKLPISIPRSAGHIPCYYNYKPSARRGYHLGGDVSPMYAFGHGLSYTTFQYDNLKLASAQIASGGSTTVSVEVSNTGNRKGAETVQLYIRDVVSSVTRPVKELKGFQKIMLNPGEKKTVNFTITPEMLSFYNADMKYVVEPGSFEIMAGGSSAQVKSVVLEVK